MAMMTPMKTGPKGPVKKERRLGVIPAWRLFVRQTSPKTTRPTPNRNRKLPNDTIAAPNRMALCYHPFRARSSMAEQTTHNRWVDGSNPSGPTTSRHPNHLRRRLYDAYALFDVLKTRVVLVRQLVASLKVELCKVAPIP